MAKRLDAGNLSLRSGAAAVVTAFMTLVLLLQAPVASAQDRQRTVPGQGGGPPDTFCILFGPNGNLDSSATPDDVAASNGIQVGNNGICDSSIVPDDVFTNSGVGTEILP